MRGAPFLRLMNTRIYVAIFDNTTQSCGIDDHYEIEYDGKNGEGICIGIFSNQVGLPTT